MSRHERCRFCKEFHDIEEHPELLNVCHDCYEEIMKWINEKKWVIVPERRNNSTNNKILDCR